MHFNNQLVEEDYDPYPMWLGVEITKLVIEEGVTKIGKGVFGQCTKLQTIVIPESVTSIGESAFTSVFGNEALTAVYCKAQAPPEVFYDSSEFGDVYGSFPNNPNMKVYVPKSALEAYQQAPGWQHYGERIVGHDF